MHHQTSEWGRHDIQNTGISQVLEMQDRPYDKLFPIGEFGMLQNRGWPAEAVMGGQKDRILRVRRK
jgi:hypothetical protein